MIPRTLEVPELRRGIDGQDVRGEQSRLVDLIGDDAVADAPVDLQRHTGEGDRVDVRIGAPLAVRGGHFGRRAAELDPGEPLQPPAVAQPPEVPIAAGHVGGSVEGDRAGQEPGMLRKEEQRLLSTHRASDRVDATRVDPHAEPLDDLRHPCQIVDLPGRAPRILMEPPALAAGIDDREAAFAGQVAPEARVDAGAHPTPVRRDDERNRAAVVRRRQQQPGWAQPPIVGAVEEVNRPGRVDVRPSLRGRDGNEDRQREQPKHPFHAREG